MKSTDEMREMVDKIIGREPSEREETQPTSPAITVNGGGTVVVIYGGRNASVTIHPNSNAVHATHASATGDGLG
jgi:hypothetical protein